MQPNVKNTENPRFKPKKLKKMTKIAFSGYNLLMTSSQTEIEWEFQFFTIVFIFWSSFQEKNSKMIEKLLRTPESDDFGFKNYENAKKQPKSDI